MGQVAASSVVSSKTAWLLPAQKVVRIRGVERQHVTNPVSLDANERRWSFTPEQPWKPGEYRVDIDSVLEDVAGNRVDHVFDVDTAENQSAAIATKSLSLPFRLKR